MGISEHEHMLIAVKNLVAAVIRYYPPEIAIKRVHSQFTAFEVRTLSYFMNEPELYSRGVFDVEGEDYRSTIAHRPFHKVRVLPTYKKVLRQLDKMGRCWHDTQEFEDFMLLVCLHDAGETVLIEIKD